MFIRALLPSKVLRAWWFVIAVTTTVVVSSQRGPVLPTTSVSKTRFVFVIASYQCQRFVFVIA